MEVEQTSAGADSSMDFRAGDVVLTQYGVGVIVSLPSPECFSVRLWRHAGKSLASCALATLQLSAVRCS
jgi:hypothetical protein